MPPQWSPVAITGMGRSLGGLVRGRGGAAMEPGGDHRDGQLLTRPFHISQHGRNGARWRSPGWAAYAPWTRRRVIVPQWSPVAITGMGDDRHAVEPPRLAPQWSPVAITGMGAPYSGRRVRWLG